DIEKEEEEDLQDKPEDGEHGFGRDPGERAIEEMTEGARPAAEEEQRSDAADGDHVGVFGHEEHRELHRAVFGVVAGGQLALGLRQVKGCTVRFCVCGHEVNEEGDELESTKEVPGN